MQILDPCVGTGSYIVNLLHRIPTHRLKYKYEHDLFCNEIMLLPYYIAALNIDGVHGVEVASSQSAPCSP